MESKVMSKAIHSELIGSKLSSCVEKKFDVYHEV